MSYQRLTSTPQGIEIALSVALQRATTVTGVSKTAMLRSGVTVQLETGDIVWVACAVQDDPETVDIDLFTCAIAADADGVIYRPNGQPVYSHFWHGIDPPRLAEVSMSTARKACMMLALGEPQPQIDGEDVLKGHDAQFADQRSIRKALAAYAELAAPLDDVL